MAPWACCRRGGGGRVGELVQRHAGRAGGCCMRDSRRRRTDAISNMTWHSNCMRGAEGGGATDSARPRNTRRGQYCTNRGDGVVCCGAVGHERLYRLSGRGSEGTGRARRAKMYAMAASRCRRESRGYRIAIRHSSEFLPTEAQTGEARRGSKEQREQQTERIYRPLQINEGV